MESKIQRKEWPWKGQLIYRNGRKGTEFRHKSFSRCVCGHSLIQSEEVFSVKKEAKSPAANKDGKKFLELEGKNVK